MARALRCKTCVELIELVPRPGFIVRGQPKYFAINEDDKRPHRERCRLTTDLRALRAQRPKPKASLRRRSSGAHSPQKELFT
jgi:hypothetical protein